MADLKKIADYNVGDEVEVLINNPRLDNKDEWRPAEVLYKRMIHQEHGAPYPILIVKVVRTYCKAEPIYRWIDGNIPVFVENNLEFYDRENEEGILYEKFIRPKFGKS
jgi:hypothetical protein